MNNMASSSSSSVSSLAFWIFLVISIFFSNVCSGLNKPTELSTSLARGWGDHFHWQSLSQGLDLAQKVDKPVMLIIHKTWCGACKRLKGDFATHAEIGKLSDHFVMVNVEDDEEPDEDKYAPDGGYIPRILFVDGKANVRVHHFNEHGNAKYKYFYSSALQVVLTMKKVIETWHYDSDEPVVDGGNGQIFDEL